jgi:hypothetical protein
MERWEYKNSERVDRDYYGRHAWGGTVYTRAQNPIWSTLYCFTTLAQSGVCVSRLSDVRTTTKKEQVKTSV